MFVEMTVPECDMNNIKYPTPVKGAGAIAQGATGRWCIVLYAGPEYLKEHNIKPLTYDEAVAICEEKGGWADF